MACFQHNQPIGALFFFAYIVRILNLITNKTCFRAKLCCSYVIKELVHAFSYTSYGCSREVWRALKKLELLSAIASSNSYVSFVLKTSPNFRRASITGYTHAKQEPIVDKTVA